MADQLLEIAGYVRRMKDLGASNLTDSPRIYGEQVTATLVDSSGTAIAFGGSNATAGADGQTAANVGLSAVGIYNGTTIDRARDANTARDSAGTGLLGAGVLGWDSGASLYRRILSTTAGLLKVDGSGVTQPVAGTKTSNNAAPDGSNVGALTALANAAAPSWTEGNLVPLSSDLTGKLRVLSTSTMTGTPADAFAAPSAVGQAQTFQQIYNGTTYDRLRDAQSAAGGVIGILAAGNLIFDGTNWQKQPTANNVQGTTGATIPASGMLYWDGTNWQRWAGTSGRAPMVSLQQVGNVEADALSNTLKLLSDNASNIVSLRSIPFVFNGTTWDRAREVIGDAQAAAGIAATHGTLWNGTNYDRTYSANAASNTTGTGLLGTGLLGWDGTNWQKAAITTASTRALQIAGGGNQADGVSNAPVGFINSVGNTGTLAASQYVYNGASSDRARNNNSVTVLTSASRGTTQNVAVTTYNARRMTLIVNVTTIGTGSITPSIQLTDVVSGTNFTVWTAAAALVGNGMAVYRFETGNTGATGGLYTEKITTDVPGRTLNVLITANNANNVVYSVSLELGV